MGRGGDFDGDRRHLPPRGAQPGCVYDPQGNPSTSPSVLPVPANNAALGIRGVPPGAANNSVDIQFSKVPFVKGEFDVKEAFAETEIPLISNTLFLQQLNFNGAVRWADYSGSGSILAYKMGLDDHADPGRAPARDLLP